ncbi:hypothetical protein ACWDE9_39495 [Streptomyces olivaceoviridis]
MRTELCGLTKRTLLTWSDPFPPPASVTEHCARRAERGLVRESAAPRGTHGPARPESGREPPKTPRVCSPGCRAGAGAARRPHLPAGPGPSRCPSVGGCRKP